MHQVEGLGNELTDSLQHSDIARVFAGIVCGLAAGLLFLALTMFTAPAGMKGMWWPQTLATMLYGGGALAYDASQKIIFSGLAIHLFLSCFCGLLMGKMTQTSEIPRLLFYGFVMGLLCWLATNMFGPNFMDRAAVLAIGQWYRGFLYVTFGLSLGFAMSLASRALKN